MDKDQIQSGFTIDRTLEDTLKICEEELHLENNRKKGDYDVRKGVTQEPITTEDINNMHPLHNLLRCFGWLFKICYHATAGHLKWSEAKLDVSNRVAQALAFLKQAKEEIQARVKEETSITLEKADPTGHGGTSTTGNIAKVKQQSQNPLIQIDSFPSQFLLKIIHISTNLENLQAWLGRFPKYYKQNQNFISQGIF